MKLNQKRSIGIIGNFGIKSSFSVEWGKGDAAQTVRKWKVNVRYGGSRHKQFLKSCSEKGNREKEISERDIFQEASTFVANGKGKAEEEFDVAVNKKRDAKPVRRTGLVGSSIFSRWRTILQ